MHPFTGSGENDLNPEEADMTPKEMLNNIHWLGHDGFRIDAGKVVYIDPYGIEGGPEADLILVTHEHFDHCSP